MICDLSSRTFFCYLQLKSFLRSALGSGMTLSMISDLEGLFHGVMQLVRMDNAKRGGGGYIKQGCLP